MTNDDSSSVIAAPFFVSICLSGRRTDWQKSPWGSGIFSFCPCVFSAEAPQLVGSFRLRSCPLCPKLDSVGQIEIILSPESLCRPQRSRISRDWRGTKWQFILSHFVRRRCQNAECRLPLERVAATEDDRHVGKTPEFLRRGQGVGRCQVSGCEVTRDRISCHRFDRGF
jgi:hypothetical protein